MERTVFFDFLKEREPKLSLEERSTLEQSSKNVSHSKVESSSNVPILLLAVRVLDCCEPEGFWSVFEVYVRLALRHTTMFAQDSNGLIDLGLEHCRILQDVQDLGGIHLEEHAGDLCR